MRMHARTHTPTPSHIHTHIEFKAVNEERAAEQSKSFFMFVTCFSHVF